MYLPAGTFASFRFLLVGFFFLNSCIYLFMLFGRAGSLLLLRLFLQLWRAWGSSLVAVFRLLLAVPSLVPEQRL